ncbi:MAG: TspO/MBR family protein [Erysipelotrichaceae bacterium]
MEKHVRSRFLILATYILTILVNASANLLPLNGKLSKDISDMYRNLFTPASYTFSIWSLIYLLLAFYVGYMVIKKFNEEDEKHYQEIGLYFIASSIFNCLWIIAWHYNLILITLVLMALLFISVGRIYVLVQRRKDLIPSIAFGIYYGWISIATIANVAIFLTFMKFDGFGIEPRFWTVATLILGFLIICACSYKNKDPFYILTGIWAYAGIFYEHIRFWKYAYPIVIQTITVCVALMIVLCAFISYKRIKLYLDERKKEKTEVVTQ